MGVRRLIGSQRVVRPDVHVPNGRHANHERADQESAFTVLDDDVFRLDVDAAVGHPHARDFGHRHDAPEIIGHARNRLLHEVVAFHERARAFEFAQLARFHRQQLAQIAHFLRRLVAKRSDRIRPVQHPLRGLCRQIFEIGLRWAGRDPRRFELQAVEHGVHEPPEDPLTAPLVEWIEEWREQIGIAAHELHDGNILRILYDRTDAVCGRLAHPAVRRAGTDRETEDFRAIDGHTVAGRPHVDEQVDGPPRIGRLRIDNVAVIAKVQSEGVSVERVQAPQDLFVGGERGLVVDALVDRLVQRLRDHHPHARVRLVRHEGRQHDRVVHGRQSLEPLRLRAQQPRDIRECETVRLAIIRNQNPNGYVPLELLRAERREALHHLQPLGRRARFERIAPQPTRQE